MTLNLAREVPRRPALLMPMITAVALETGTYTKHIPNMVKSGVM